MKVLMTEKEMEDAYYNIWHTIGVLLKFVVDQGRGNISFPVTDILLLI